MSNTTDAMREMVKSGMSTLHWGLIALKGAAEENIESLQLAREEALQAMLKAKDAIAAIEFQIERSNEILRIREESLANINKPAPVVEGKP